MKVGPENEETKSVSYSYTFLGRGAVAKSKRFHMYIACRK